MSVVVVGIEHERAPLEVLERVTMGEPDVAKMLATLRERPNVAEAVVLSTCLRTEVYAVVDRFHEAVDDVYGLLSSQSGLPVETIESHGAVRFDDDVAIHVFSVASGLESAVLGESEVLGQVRRAWERAREDGACGPLLAELFRHAVQAGKRVRSETAIARGTTSFSHAAVELAGERREGGLGGATVLVLGAGEMGSGIVQALGGLPPGRRPAEVVVANRTVARAREVAERASGGAPVRTVAVSALGEEVARADVVFSAVEATGHVLAAGLLAAGPPRPVLVVDLGMPRNVEPAAAAVPGVTLLDMDHLRSAVDRALDERRGEAERAAAIVAEEMARYRTASRARAAAPVISALRGRLEEVRVAELGKHARQLAGLPEEVSAQVDEITRTVLAKLLHEPTVVLRESSGTSRGERLVEALRTLFDL